VTSTVSLPPASGVCAITLSFIAAGTKSVARADAAAVVKAAGSAPFASSTKLCAIATLGIALADTTLTVSFSPGLAVRVVMSYFIASLPWRVMTRGAWACTPAIAPTVSTAAAYPVRIERNVM
jgi:hypothetical protein